MNASSLDQLAERLNQLERRNRWLGRILVCLLAAGGVGLLGAAQGAGGQTTASDALVLRDGAGKERARLEMARQGPVLRFLDEQGKSVAVLGTEQDALVLRLFDKRGRVQTGFALEPDGIACVTRDGNGVTQTGGKALLETNGLFARD
jgi:hypothetical protein